VRICFGTVRFVLDIWEGYFGRAINWHFAQHYDRLELTIFPALNNAQTGYGFIEVGGYRENGTYQPFSLNFDIIAHEVGHLIIFGEIGVPDPEAQSANTGDFTNLPPIWWRSFPPFTSIR